MRSPILTDSEIDQLAAYFAGQEVAKTATTAEVSEREFQLGKELAENGDAADKIPSCVDCHGPGGMARDAEYPTLAGQPAWYLREQLKLFSKQHRGGSNNASLMHPIANKLSDKQIRSLAVFYERSDQREHPTDHSDPASIDGSQNRDGASNACDCFPWDRMDRLEHTPSRLARNRSECCCKVTR